MNPDAWILFQKQELLSDEQCMQFQKFTALILDWNERINLTTITKIPNIIRYHFQDSLALSALYDMATVRGVADVGSGAGFPAIPLAIKYPDMPIYIIEVNTKRLLFLQEVVSSLSLKNVEIFSHDWRTFLRTTNYSIDLFCARASLSVSELLRMFKPGCVYKHAVLAYWASRLWTPADEYEQSYIQAQQPYKVGHKKRELVFMGLPGSVNIDRIKGKKIE